MADVFTPIEYISGGAASFFTISGDTIEFNGGPINDGLRDEVFQYLKNRSKIRILGTVESDSDYYGATVISSSEGSPYVSLVTNWTSKTKASNAPFRKRVAAGEVLVSDFDHERVTCVSTPRFTGGAYYAYAQSENYDRWDLVAMGILEYVPSGPSFSKFYYRKVDAWVTNGSWGTTYSLRQGFQWAPPRDITAESVVGIVKGSREVDVGFVTSLVADANQGTLDLLTTLAEMPEVISWLSSMASRVSSLVRGIKGRRLSLTKSFENRKEHLKHKFAEDELALEIKIRQTVRDTGVFSSRRAQLMHLRNLRRQQKRLVKTYDRALRKSGIEFNDAMANVWMEFRYAIMPLVYTAIDVTESLTKSPEFLTYRDGIKSNPRVTLAPDLPELVVDRLMRVWIRDRVSTAVGPFSLSASGVTGNILTTAWELIPLSFVVDWFVNVGDTITALSGGSSIDRVSSLSWKDVLDYSHFNPEDGSSVTISGQLYNRKKVNLLTYTCLSIEQGLDTFRIFDSISLLWNSKREDLIRSSNRTRSKR